MKKIILFAFCILWSGFLSAQDNTELMIINPGRETFAHFPSATLGNKYNLTVFLPEPFVPLKGHYPLAVVLGIGAEESEAAETFLQTDKMIVAGVNFTEKDYNEPEKIVRFVSKELLPYLETNYPVLPGEKNRVIVAKGKGGARVALLLAGIPKTFAATALLSPGDALRAFVLPARGLTRILAAGTQAELAATQQALEENGWEYGSDFALLQNTKNNIWDLLKKDYLLAAKEDLALVFLKGKLAASALSLSGRESVGLKVTARLKNATAFDYVPSSLRMSPPFLVWNPSLGALSALPGAETGSVKIHFVRGNADFSVKLRLKK